ncbi:MAG: AzlC family ABC transporter permease [Oscillospiraceae bacterium]|nr:AzlC family ABC transporter permease [Oscillospiraceae bacterium]
MQLRSRYKQGLLDGVPIALGYLSVSFAFGISAAAGGLSAAQAVLLSMTNLTSAGQVAGLSLMCSAASLGEMAATQLVINLRYALMSLSLSQKLDRSVTRAERFLIAFFNTDEIFAVAASGGEVATRYMLGLGTLPWLGWATGTLLGAVAGELLPAAVTAALGMAIYGMFIAIVAPAARRSRPVLAVVALAAGLSVFLRYCVPAVSSGFSIILCALAASAFGALAFPLQEAAE